MTSESLAGGQFSSTFDEQEINIYICIYVSGGTSASKLCYEVIGKETSQLNLSGTNVPDKLTVWF